MPDALTPSYTPEELLRFGLSPVAPTAAPPATAPATADPIAAAGLAPADSAVGQRLLHPPTQEVRAAPADWLPQDPVSKFARSAADTATFGLSNWAIGAAHAIPSIAAWFGGDRSANPATDLTMSRDQASSDVKNFRNDDPLMGDISKGVGVGGQLAQGFGLDRLVAPVVGAGLDAATGALRAPSIAAVARQGAATGGVMGAEAGAGEAPPGSSAADVARSTGVGAAVGTLSGGIAAPVAQGAVDVVKNTFRAGTTMSEGAGQTAAGIAGRNPTLGTPAEAGENVAGALASKAALAQTEAEGAYKDAAAMGAAAHPAVVQAYPALVQSEVRNSIGLELGTPESRAQFPKANAAFDAITRMGGTGGALPLDGPRGAQSIAETRRILNGPLMTPSKDNPGDMAALTAVRRAYNDVFSTMGKQPGAIIGPAAAVQRTLEGNAAYSQYKGLTAPRDTGPTAAAKQKLASWINSSADGQTVAADLFGATTSPSIKGVQSAVDTVNEVKSQFGPKSAEMNAIQQGLFLKATGTAPNGAAFTPAQVKSNLLRLTAGQSAPLGSAVFSRDQVIAIKRFANSIPDEGFNRLGDTTLKAAHLAGAAVGTALGLHYVGTDLGPLTFGVLGGTTAVGAQLASATTGSILHRFAGLSQNPLLYKPIFAERAARVGGETVAANLAGVDAANFPKVDTGDTP